MRDVLSPGGCGGVVELVVGLGLLKDNMRVLFLFNKHETCLQCS